MNVAQVLERASAGTYAKEIQCANCRAWRPWSQAYQSCGFCGQRIGARERFVFVPAEPPTRRIRKPRKQTKGSIPR